MPPLQQSPVNAAAPEVFHCDFVLRDWLSILLLPFALNAATPHASIGVTLDFSRPVFQLDGTDGASACQFHAAKPDGSAAAANVAYSTLAGFPDDSPSTEFGQFCDAAFSTNGMALSQLWVTPCPLQTPPHSVGDHDSADAWPRLDFSMYEPGVLPTNRFYHSHGNDMGPIRGHTVSMLMASLRRARAEGMRVSYWTDAHTDFPPWISPAPWSAAACATPGTFTSISTITGWRPDAIASPNT